MHSYRCCAFAALCTCLCAVLSGLQNDSVLLLALIPFKVVLCHYLLCYDCDKVIACLHDILGYCHSSRKTFYCM